MRDTSIEDRGSEMFCSKKMKLVWEKRGWRNGNENKTQMTGVKTNEGRPKEIKIVLRCRPKRRKQTVYRPPSPKEINPERGVLAQRYPFLFLGSSSSARIKPKLLSQLRGNNRPSRREDREPDPWREAHPQPTAEP